MKRDMKTKVISVIDFSEIGYQSCP